MPRPVITQEKELTRKQLSRREREARSSRRLVIGTAAVLGLIVLVLAWGLYDQFVLKPRRPVAIVKGVPITLETYQSVVQYRRWDYRNYLNRLEAQKQQLSASADNSNSFLIQYIDQQIQQVQSGLMNVSTGALDDLIDDQLARQECAKRGITVTPDDIQLKLETQFGYDRNPPTPVPVTDTTPITSTTSITDTGEITSTTPITPTPTVVPMTKDQFVQNTTQWFQLMSQSSGFTEKQFRGLLESELYREKLDEVIKAEVPKTAEQVHARHILLKTQEEADKALARLKSGEDFAKVATELSQDTSNKDQGGDLGWFARGMMVEPFEKAAFALQPGQLSDVVQTDYGFHIIKVEERDANRELDPQALSQLQSKAITDWFDKARTSPDVVRKWDSSMIPAERPTPRPQRQG